MALPKIETPTYELTLPSQDIKVNLDLSQLKKKKY